MFQMMASFQGASHVLVRPKRLPRIVLGLSIHFVHRYNGKTTKREKRETLLPVYFPDD